MKVRSIASRSAHTASLAYRIKMLTKEYEEEFTQQPSIAELAAALGVTESMIKTSLEATTLQNTISLDATIGNEDGSIHIALFKGLSKDNRSVIALKTGGKEFIKWHKKIKSVVK